MWIYLVLLSIGSVQTFTLSSNPDKPVDITVSLVHNETDGTTEDNTTLENTGLSTDLETEDVLFPYMAAILHVSNVVLGAGAIVGENWVICTGFQIGAFEADQLMVRVGSQSALSGGDVVAIDRVYPHPMYHQFNNDVALLKTTGSLLENTTAKIILIASTSPQFGAEANFLLWNKEHHLRSSAAGIVPETDCKVFFPDFELTESNVCVVLDHILPYSVALYGSLLVVNETLLGLYMGLEANTVKPYLCSCLPPLRNWVMHMMANENQTSRLFPLT